MIVNKTKSGPSRLYPAGPLLRPSPATATSSASGARLAAFTRLRPMNSEPVTPIRTKLFNLINRFP